MNQSANKIQIPVKTKIAFVAATLLSLFNLSQIDLPKPDCDCAITAHQSISILPFSFAVLFLLLVVILFFNKKYKIIWRCNFIFLIVTALIFSFIAMIEESFDYVFLPLAMSIFAFVFLVIDRKNYFAAVEKGKNKAADESGLTK